MNKHLSNILNQNKKDRYMLTTKTLLKITALICAIALILPLTSCARKTGYEAFERTREIGEKTFRDITTESADYETVKAVYELELFNGDHNKMFNPQGQLTVSEAVALIVRINSIFTGKKPDYAPVYSTDPWYTGYVNQAERRGLFPTQKTYTRFTRGIRIEDFYAFIANTLPEAEYTPVYPGKKASDIEDNIYFAEINKLIESGILPYNEGDELNPRDFVTRIDAAKMILKLIKQDSRG